MEPVYAFQEYMIDSQLSLIRLQVRIGAGSQNKGIFVQVPGVTEDEYHVSLFAAGSIYGA